MQKKLIFLSFSLLFILKGYSQLTIEDISRLKQSDTTRYKDRLIKFQANNYNPVSLFFGGLMYIYQKQISPQISADCMFRPSCSEYSKNLIQHYGLLKGILLTTDRLTRCNRISAIDVNPNKVDDKDHKIHELVERYEY